jgi:hypothetical protein
MQPQSNLYKQSPLVEKEVYDLRKRIFKLETTKATTTTPVATSTGGATSISGNSSITTTNNLISVSKVNTSVSNNTLKKGASVASTQVVQTTIDLGTVLAGYVFEELKCIITIPVDNGVIFQVVDANNNIIIDNTQMDLTKVGSATANVNKKITSQLRLIGILTGINTIANVDLIFIKKVWQIPS